MQTIFEFSVPPQNLRGLKRVSLATTKGRIASPEPQFSGFKLLPSHFRWASKWGHEAVSGAQPGWFLIGVISD
jgi:hypothetical protein